MGIDDLIASDVVDLRDYFERLLLFAEASARAPSSGDAPQFSSEIPYRVRSHLACEVYSFVDFWLAELCGYNERKNGLSESFVKFKNDKKNKG